MAKRLVVALNAQRLNFDQRLDLSALRSAAQVVLHDSTPPHQILERVRGCEVVITKELALGRETILAFDASVRLIVEAGTGFNNIDVEAANSKQILVCNCPAYSTDAVATLVLTHVLNFSSSLVAQQRRIWAGDREHFRDADANIGSMPHFELGGKTIGLIGGSGAVGTRVAELARAFGMRVIVSSRGGRAPPGATVEQIDDLLRSSDFVSVHAPLCAGTRHLLDARRLALLRPSAYLINTARGALIDEAALVAALDQRRFAGAALDVQDPEPPEPDSPMYAMDNLVLTPHIGWRRLETRQRLVDAVTANVAAYLAGAPTNVVSAPAPQTQAARAAFFEPEEETKRASQHV
ncbi:D-isomer specific 2-hydroxyacid dehydrogenase [Pelagophyceae sp. CCMP2097]|nr:D-isomer specific 2-hydroxyacid dehydrogenase [Pelagophyceae sp. CCMP2097]|mmetsp:Transcript_27818/g.93537  ORF Transcript_27818/g.93537 Transcript_27818/m.93537 type:complete len:351 (-) Transcript_27818:298-1350(-)